ncbi:MAG: N-acetylmuramoyl-L-alanine amidase [Silvanigrellales bacterium]|nr:N-acetylmuramoyl-L-alanine amidase [Silvanigrellales bacterium]
MERRNFLLAALAGLATACKNKIEGTAKLPPNPSCPPSAAGTVTFTRDGQCVQAPAQIDTPQTAPLPALTPSSPPAVAGTLSGLKVTLDVGHGAYDGGWESGANNKAKGLVEYELNRDEALMVAELMRSKGAQVKVNDYKRGAKGLSLSQKGQAAGDANVFVSIHHNSASAAAQGTEVLYHTQGSNSDKALAGEIQKRMVTNIWNGDSSLNRGAKAHSLGVLGGVPKTVKACCLTEAFFISANDATKSSAQTWVKGAAKAIAEGIEAYWDSSQLSLSLYGEVADDYPPTPFEQAPDDLNLYKDH